MTPDVVTIEEEINRETCEKRTRNEQETTERVPDYTWTPRVLEAERFASDRGLLNLRGATDDTQDLRVSVVAFER